MRTISLSQLESDLAKVEKQLQRFNELALERQKIKDLIDAFKARYPEDATKKPKQPPVVVVVNIESTESYAERVLSESGPLNTVPLMLAIRKMGWIGSGVDEKDRDRVYQALKRRPDKFTRLPDQRWKKIV